MKLLFVNLGLKGKQILEATEEVVIEETEEEQDRQIGWGREGRQDSLARRHSGRGRRAAGQASV